MYGGPAHSRTHTHTRGFACVKRFVCVIRVLDLLTHVFNWNCMQSAYCSTNRICTWRCQPEFFRGLLSVLHSHTVRQGHLAHLTETLIETRSSTVNAPVPLTYICCHYNHINHDYFPFLYFSRSCPVWNVLRLNTCLCLWVGLHTSYSFDFLCCCFL